MTCSAGARPHSGCRVCARATIHGSTCGISVCRDLMLLVISKLNCCCVVPSSRAVTRDAVSVPRIIRHFARRAAADGSSVVSATRSRALWSLSYLRSAGCSDGAGTAATTPMTESGVTEASSAPGAAPARGVTARRPTTLGHIEPPLPPEDFAQRYAIGGAIGAGSYCTVHAGVERATGRAVAIKIIHHVRFVARCRMHGPAAHQACIAMSGAVTSVFHFFPTPARFMLRARRRPGRLARRATRSSSRSLRSASAHISM